MQATSLFLLLLLPPADTAGDLASSIQASLRQELGEVSMAIAPDALVTPSMWQGEHAQLRARFVVHVVWKTDDEAAVELVPGSDPPGKSYHEVRELTFAPQDGTSERGRAIGLVIAELLRSSPTSAWAEGAYGKAAPTAATAPSRLQPGGMFASERATAGSWAFGAALTYRFGLTEALHLRAAAMSLFGTNNQYREMGLTAGIDWDFLRLAQNRFALGAGLFAGFFYESASITVSGSESGGDETTSHSASPSQANAAAGASLRARVTVWRSLRLVAEGSLRALSGGMSAAVSAGTAKKDVSYSHWRPGFLAGLELAL